MFTRLTAKGFRGFENVSVSNLRSINVITGANSSGKTTLLEAIFLLCSANNSSIPMVLAEHRGERRWNPEVDRAFRAFFYKLAADQDATITALSNFANRSKVERRSLKLSPIFSAELSSSTTKGKEVMSGIRMLAQLDKERATGEIAWQNIPQQSAANKGTEPLKQLIRESIQPDWYVLGALLTPHNRDNLDLASERLTELIKAKKTESVVERLRIIEPALTGLHAVNEKGLTATYADVGMPRLLPVSVLGAGFINLLILVTQIEQMRPRVMLLDEVENGMHYSIIPHIVDYLVGAAMEKGIQFFITTHSAEFLRIFLDRCEDREFTEFSLFRFARTSIGVKVESLDSTKVSIARELNAELR